LKAALQKRLVADFGDEFATLVESDKIAVEEMRNGDEINFSISTEIKNEFLCAEIGLHSISKADLLLRFAVREFGLDGFPFDDLYVVRLDTDEELDLNGKLISDIFNDFADGKIPLDIRLRKKKRKGKDPLFCE